MGPATADGDELMIAWCQLRSFECSVLGRSGAPCLSAPRWLVGYRHFRDWRNRTVFDQMLERLHVRINEHGLIDLDLYCWLRRINGNPGLFCSREKCPKNLKILRSGLALGGLTTKIYMLCSANDVPLRFLLAGSRRTGQQYILRHAVTSMQRNIPSLPARSPLHAAGGCWRAKAMTVRVAPLLRSVLDVARNSSVRMKHKLKLRLPGLC